LQLILSEVKHVRGEVETLSVMDSACSWKIMIASEILTSIGTTTCSMLNGPFSLDASLSNSSVNVTRTVSKITTRYTLTLSAPCDFLFKCAVHKYTYLLTYLLKYSSTTTTIDVLARRRDFSNTDKAGPLFDPEV